MTFFSDEKFVAAGAIALTVTLVAIFWLRPLAERLGLVDSPDQRKRHRGRIPLIGGLCFFLGTLAGLAYLGYLGSFVGGLLAAGALVLLTGLVDDMENLSVRSRLAVQAGIVGIMVASTGVYVDDLGNAFGTQLTLHAAIGIPLTVIAVIGLINAFNMLDGIDGLAAGVAMVSILSIIAFASGGWPALGVLMMLQILFIALVPYISVNLGWPDGNKIFMGDAGSTLIGFLLAWSLIYMSRPDVAVLAPVDVLWCIALPLMETLAVIYYRLHRGVSPFKPDRGHLHHLLQDAGFSARVTLGLILLLASGLGGAGYLLRTVPEPASLATFMALLLLYVMQRQRVLRWLASRQLATARAGAREQQASAPPPALRPSAMRVLCVLGATSDAARVAPVIRHICSDRRFEANICVVALPDQRPAEQYAAFDIRPQHVLNVVAPPQELTDIASAPLRGMKRVLSECRPDLVVVHGDSLTTMAATLAAYFQRIPVARVETGAGLGSGLGDDPTYSDEAARRITSTLVSMHFTPSANASRQLIAAGVPAERITVAGDPAIDSLRTALARIRQDDALRRELAQRFSFLRPGSRLLLATRRGAGGGYGEMGRALRNVAMRRPDIDVVYPLALVPEGAHGAGLLGWRPANLHLVEPLDHLAWAYLLSSAYLVLSGSRDLEQEAAMLGKPVLLVEEDPEPLPAELGNVRRLARQEPRSAGAAAGTPVPGTERLITERVLALLNDEQAYGSMCAAQQGDDERGACAQIVETLARLPARARPVAA